MWRTTHKDAETAWGGRKWKDGGTSPRQAPPKEHHIERRKRKSPTSNNSRTGKRMCKWAMWSKTPRRRTGRTLEKCGKHTKLNNCENATEQMKWRRAKLHQKRSWEPHKKAMLCVFNNAPIPCFCSDTLCSWNDGSVLSLVQALPCGTYVRVVPVHTGTF